MRKILVPPGTLPEKLDGVRVLKAVVVHDLTV
jgi:hypothetical protein